MHKTRNSNKQSELQFSLIDKIVHHPCLDRTVNNQELTFVIEFGREMYS